MPDPTLYPVEKVNDGSVTVGATSTLVLAANPKRVDLELVNDSDTAIYLARGNAAVMNKGIPLTAKGSSYGMNSLNLFLGAIYAIGTGEQNLCYSEGERTN